MALKTKQIRKQTQSGRATRKSKFQADLAPAEDRMVRGLKQELQLTSNTDFLSDALALFRWAVWERKHPASGFVAQTHADPKGDAKQRIGRAEFAFGAYRPLISPDPIRACKVIERNGGVGDDGTRTRDLCRDSELV